MNYRYGLILSAALALSTAAFAAKPTISKSDIDLWTYSSSTAVAPGNSLAEFKALPGLLEEQREPLNGNKAATETQGGVQLVTLTYGTGLRLRAMDYGDKAFLTQVRVIGPSLTLKDDIRIGSTRTQVENLFGRPVRGSSSYAVFEGEADTLRFQYENDVVTAIEIDRR